MRRSLHPTIVVLPLGLLSTGVIFDFVRLLGGSPLFTLVAYYMILGGLVTGVAAAIFGCADQLSIPRGSRSYKLGVIHGVVNAIVLMLYAGSLYVRSNDPSQPEILPTLLSTLGAGFALVGGCLGGELADRLRTAAQVTEHPDAPISLSLSNPTRGRAILVQRQHS